jgi:replicative DNA helicase
VTTVAEPSFDRAPPQDNDAEMSVLGGMLLSKDAISDVVEILTASDFYKPQHATIFQAIVDKYADGEPADAVTIAHALTASGQLVKVGGAPYLHTLLSCVPTAANAAYYARLVGDRSTRRRVIEAGTRVVQLGYTLDRDVEDVVNLAQGATYEIAEQRRGTNPWAAFKELMQPTLDEIEAIGLAGGAMRGIPTGFADLDRLLNGLQEGQLVVVAGRPGSGKSTMAADVARCAAIKHNLATAFFSLEMSGVELMMRFLSAESRVPLNVLRSGQLTDDDWTKLARRMGEISEAPIFVDDTANMTLMEIRAKARRLKQLHGLKLIVVDYLGLMTATSKGGNSSRNDEVASLSRGLKLLAKELRVPVIAVHQLNRGPEQRTEKRPQLSDLRDSGAVEQDADIVIFVHRDDYYDKESVRAGEADFIVAKHRNGPTDTVTVAAQLHLARFVDMAIS